jgi:hypothetical protein
MANRDERPKNWVNDPDIDVQSPNDDAFPFECRIPYEPSALMLGSLVQSLSLSKKKGGPLTGTEVFGAGEPEN